MSDGTTDGPDRARGDGPPVWEDGADLGRGGEVLDDSARLPDVIVRGDRITITPPVPPILSFIHPDPGAMTVLFGDGAAGKGTFAAWIVAQATAEGRKVLVLDAEGHRMEWARRVTALGGVGRRWVHWNHPIGVPRLDDYSGRFDLVVLDSAAYFATDDDALMGASGATRLQEALSVTRIPALVIAHVTKGADADKPYGSVFWHNTARVTLRLTDDGTRRTLRCFKATDVLGMHKGDSWDVTAGYEEDGITPQWVHVVPSNGLTFVTPRTMVQQVIDTVLEDGEAHGIMAFTLHGFSAQAYRQALAMEPDVEQVQGPRPERGGNPTTLYRRRQQAYR